MITFDKVSKHYQHEWGVTKALDEVSFTINPLEFVVVLGPSGSGKSTMLNLMGALDQVTDGKIQIQKQTISAYQEKQRLYFRRHHVGFVFQEYNLLNTLTVAENIEMVAHISKDPETVDDVLDSVGLKAHKNKYPHELSGGEQQRVSIARALVKKPHILLCDEPTGSLDEDVAKQVLKVLRSLKKKHGTTVVFITHNVAISEMADRVLKLNSGQLVENKTHPSPKAIDDIRF